MPHENPGEAPRPNTNSPPREPGRPAGDRPKFFLAVFQSGFRGSRIYRVYPGPEGLLFLYAGPLVVWIDVEMARRIDPTHWAVKAAGALRTGAVAAVGGALIIAAVVLRLVLRAARDDPSAAADILTGAVVITVLGVVFAIVAVTVSVRRVTTRVAYLDALTEDELRAEAARDKWSFRVTARNVSDVCIDPLDKSNVLGARPGGPVARLAFTHDPTGKWKLNLVRAKDIKAAVRAFRRLLGPGKVEVTVPLEGE
jgi:hypothetical protein